MRKYLSLFAILILIATNHVRACDPTYGAATITVSCNSIILTGYPHNGHLYYYGGVYTETLTNSQGCDSIITFTLITTGPGSSSRTVNLYACQLPYFTGCEDVFGPGTYSCPWDVGNPECGDSMSYITITVIPVDTVRTNTTICYSQAPYYWYGQPYYEAGKYTTVIPGPGNSCSVEELNLTVRPSPESYTDVSVCPNLLPYHWNGQVLTQAGIYSAPITRPGLCDSFAVLSLYVLPNTTSTTNVTVCANQLPYTWNGNNYNSSGTYTATIAHAGCDSIATLNLTVRPLTTISSFTPTSANNGQAVVITGTNFTGATSVSFGGTPASSFTVQSSTSIIATVGAGATGAVTVTTPCNTATAPGFSHAGSAGNIGIGTNIAPSRLTIGSGDIYITDIGSGIILKSPNGNCWRITIDNNGNLIRTAITCP